MSLIRYLFQQRPASKSFPECHHQVQPGCEKREDRHYYAFVEKLDGQFIWTLSNPLFIADITCSRSGFLFFDGDISSGRPGFLDMTVTYELLRRPKTTDRNLRNTSSLLLSDQNLDAQMHRNRNTDGPMPSACPCSPSEIAEIFWRNRQSIPSRNNTFSFS
jgi:hypothetical protein